MDNLHDMVGIVGVACVLGAYFLLQIGRWHQDTPRYSVVNAIGALLILFSLYFDFNLPSVIIEIAWLLISLLGIYRTVRYSYHHKKYS